MHATPLSTTRARRRMTAAAVLAVLVLPVGSAITASADPIPGTTPGELLQTTPETTPTPTTPSPAPTTPTLLGAATAARVTWTPPASIAEEQRVTLAVTGEINGQATGHAALLPDAASCPASPLYPRQIAVGPRIPVTAAAGPADATPAPLGGTTTHTMSLTVKDSGQYRLCGWLVAFPSASEASTVASLDQPVTVTNRPSTLAVEMLPTARAGDYFTVKLTGTTPAAGRRLLIMAEPGVGHACELLRKAPSGKRPLQSVVGLPSGDYTKTLRLRYRSKTAGPHVFCVQVVEAGDRSPEAAFGQPMEVTEGLKCVNTQTALSQRTTDLTVIRNRRDSAQQRLAAAKKKLAPARAKVSKQRKISDRRVASARKALRRAKSKAGKKRASRRLAQVKKTEKARVYRAAAPLRKANASVRLHERSYKQYRTGANLLSETITRTKKDLKKYCAKA